MIHEPEHCIHRWNIDRDNIGTCSRCDEVRQFPWDKGEVIILKKGKYTEIPKKEDNMKTSIRERHTYYEEHKVEIIADLLSTGRAATKAKWDIPHGGVIYGLEKRWLTAEQIASIPKRSLTPTPAVPTDGKAQGFDGSSDSIDIETEKFTWPSKHSTPLNAMPKFPEFSDTWDCTVQLKWLELYGELVKERRESFYVDNEKTVRAD